MRILFSMKHRGNIRNFDAVLRLLLEAGHDVCLSFMSAREKRGCETLLAGIQRDHPGLTLGRVPRQAPPVHEPSVRTLRALGDYLRYLTPPLEGCDQFRRRAGERLPAWMPRTADRLLSNRPVSVRRLARAIAAVERGMPRDPRIDILLGEYAPDVLLVTPYVDLASPQCDFVRSARALGIPSGLCVHSWDNLTNKGTIRVAPDMVMVWNDAQKAEAVDLHGSDPTRIRVTGAHPYDHWFTWAPTRTRLGFCQNAGLDPLQPFLVYLCSSPQIAPREVEFVRGWIAALRSSASAMLRRTGVLVRPHPFHAPQWRDADLSDLQNAVVWPRGGANPIDEVSRNEYFDSLYHAVGIAGINTSALIEAGILARPVFTIKDPMFAATQDGTLHFHHLVSAGGGLLHVAGSLADHLEQIRPVVEPDSGSALADRNTGFIRTFVRPHGLDVPAAPRLVDAILELATWQPSPARVAWTARAAARSMVALGSLGRWVRAHPRDDRRIGKLRQQPKQWSGRGRSMGKDAKPT